MNFGRLLDNACFSPSLQGSTKEAIIREMVELMVGAGHVSDREAAVQAILEREKKMSTGMQHGVAMPHGKTDSVPNLILAIALKKDGVDFQSLDEEPSKIFVMTLFPAKQASVHLRVLAEIGRVLNDPAVRQGLVQAQTLEQVKGILLGTKAG